MRKFIISAASLILFSSAHVYAEPVSVSIAGFAFAGSFDRAPERFPISYKLFSDQQLPANQASSYTAMVVDKALSLKNPDFKYTRGELVSLNNDRSLMAALVLTGETIATENYGAYYKTFVNLRGDTMIFDYKNKSIVRNCPVSVVLYDATPQPPSEQRLAGFVDNLIRRPDERGLISQFNRCLQLATIPRDGVRTVQVRNADISPEALAVFPPSLRAHPEAVRAILMDTLASTLTARTGISMLPSSIGHAVGGVMSMRLQNGDDIKLKLAEGDYVFDIKLNKFAKIKTAETNVSATYVYGAYMSMNFSEPLLNTAFISTDLKSGEVAVLPAGQIGGDDFAAYQDAIRGLYNKFADALVQPNSSWIKGAASEKAIEAQMATARETLRNTK